MSRRSGALWLVFTVAAVVSSALVLRRPSWDRLSDLHIYYGAALTVHDGQPLYGFVAENGGPFTYPPFAMLVLWPIGLVPEHLLQLMWLALTVAALAAVAVAVGRALATDPDRQRLAAAAVACGLILSAPAQSNLRFGQVSIFIVLLALIDAMGLTPARYRGVLIGVAAAVKLTPLLFVAYFLFSRRYRDAARALAAFAGCALLAAAVLPADSWTFWTRTVFTTSRIGDLASLGNQSLHGMLLRIGVAGGALPLIWATLIAIVCVAALVRARALHLAGDPARAAILVGCATVAASPVSWTHHQVWPVLAAMFLIATPSLPRRVAGLVVLAVMTLSLSVLLSRISTTPDIQFLLENARTLAVITICSVGFGTFALPVRRLVWARAAATATAALALVAVLPLPAGADPTFKAYSLAEMGNPRYFFVCRTATDCERLAFAAVNFGVAWEPTKVRVSGVVDKSVARLEFRSAPGGAPRVIPLAEIYPGRRGFAFRSASISHGRLTAYDHAGRALESLST